MHIWWLYLRPTGGTPTDPGETRTDQAERAQEFCRKHSVLGMGWSVEGGVLSWNDYRKFRERRRKEHGPYDDSGNVNRWKEQVSIGDLVWTKTEDRQFWLARITGDWHYDLSSAAMKADMVNQRPAMIVEIDKKDVPSAVAEHSHRRTVHKMGEVDLPHEKSQVADAVVRYPNLLPQNLEHHCALWQRLRGASSE